MATRIDQKQQTRRKLIETAIRLSAERGFGALSLREVTTGAGITPAAFYRHFRDMNDLGLALIDEVGLGLRQLLRDARGSFRDVRQGTVRASIETFLKFITENPNLFRVLLGERQGSSADYRKALQTEIARFIDDFTDDIERWSQATRQPMAETALAAEMIVTVVFTVGAEAIELPKHRRGELTERLVKEVKMILRGARATYQKANNRSARASSRKKAR
jgi:AcrR family transcriptional regulator